MRKYGLNPALLLAIVTLVDICPATGRAAAPAPPPDVTAKQVAPAQPVTAAPGAAPGAATAPAALPPFTAPMTAAQVITVLDQTVDWYRTLGVQQQAANAPSDMLILYDNRQTANRVMSLAFDIARTDAEMLAKQADEKPDDGADAATSSQALSQLQKKLDAQGATVAAELTAAQQPQRGSSNKSHVETQAKINELKGELDLINTKRTILVTMAGFTAGAGGSSSLALKSQIDAMAVAIPAAASAAAPAAAGAGTATAATPGTTSSPAQTAANAPAPVSVSVGSFGLWDLASNAFRLSEKIRTIESIDRRTTALQNTLTGVRTPLLNQLKSLSARGDALAAQADSANAATLNGVRDQLDALSDQFKQASELLIPLSREGILLSQYRHNLGNWRDAARMQYRSAITTFSIRLGILAVILAVIFGAAELWRRTVLRYIQDSRRRYQLLLLRRIALWSVVVIVIGFAFASELGSIVTFAGLITAGIAVAMQSVLVSIVGYFFLIGKYGIRVGDRVQIGEVAGEVIDLGLVRMYLMELGAKGAMGPTGRVVAFANSVVFQVSSGLFKQIPGVNFSWREVVLTLPNGSDYTSIKEKLTSAVTAALQEYLPEIERQTQEIARTTLSSSAGDSKPQVQLHFAGLVVEAHVRYPVQLQHAAEIDEHVTEALANVILAATPAVPAALK